MKLDVDFIPWPDYYTRLNASLTSGENKYNMAVSDSQWLGAFIEAGYYRKLNDLIDADPDLKAVSGRDASCACFRPTQPIRTGRKTTTDFRRCRTSSINYYRTDVVCNEEEQANFQAKYNVKLPCTPEEMDEIDWDMFEKIGEFFMRKKGEKLAGQVLDDDFYGIAYQAGKGYDINRSRLTASFGSMEATFGMKRRRPPAMPKAS